MADNTALNAGTGGDTMRDLDRSGVKTPIVGIDLGIGTGTEVLMTGTMPISGTVAATQSGTWSFTLGVGSAVIGHVIVDSGTVSVTGSVAVTGTFFQATQPVSGTVTVNAGTNLNTSLLALGSGGNLATLVTRIPALGQALAAASTPVVLTAAQITTLTPLSTVGISGSVAVTGTFWQATQPVSGTVTANAGTGNFTVVGTGTFVVQAAQSGTWNVGTVTTVSTVTAVTTVSTVTTVGTVTAVTAITNALPAGTNLLGKVSASHETDTVYSGTTALTPKFAIITASASGATTVVAAVASKKIRVLRWSLSSNGTVNVKWQSHTTPTDLTGLTYMVQYAKDGGAYCPVGLFQTIAGEALDINLSAAVAVGGMLTYVEV